MSREWHPGDVVEAFALTRNRRHRLLYVGKRGGSWPWRLLDAERDVDGCGIGASNVKDVVPVTALLDGLVVIDPTDREQVEALRRAILGPLATAQSIESIADALRSLITPPKPDEPTGVGAVVLDSDDLRWVRVQDQNCAPWIRTNSGYSDIERPYRYWSDIDAVKVLSEGVAA